ncbi:ATP-binding protein [Granulosicoccus sp. 3-233]|uniref:ATP-binding protein n=1 Tax=Granulosicoccus sp. 3-233 TaxID=3417969 RepID=UPI003D356AD3
MFHGRQSSMRRLSLSLLLVVIVAIVGAGWAMDRLFARLDHGDDDDLQIAEQLGYRMVTWLDGIETLPAESVLPASDEAYDAYLIARDSIALPEPLGVQLADGQVVMLESRRGVALHFLLPKSQRILVLTVPQPSSGGTALRLLLTIVFYSCIILLVLVWLYPLIRRLQKLATAARCIGQGDLSQRIETRPASQLYDIESEFNAMAQRIQVLMEDNRMLSSAVSHDLRTPLARLRFGVDALDETSLDARQGDYVARISKDLDSMEQLVNVLLEFARLEQRLDELPRRAVSLLPIVQQAIDSQSPDASMRVETLVIGDVPTVMADERYTLMLINNLMQNAVAYARSRIRVSISVQDGRVKLQIDDDGPGFPELEVERLFKPFQKGSLPNVPDQAVHGYGLGLAIVERIVRWLGASVSLGRSSDLQGARVTVGFGMPEITGMAAAAVD